MGHEETGKLAQYNRGHSPHPRSIGSRRAADVSRVVRVCKNLRWGSLISLNVSTIEDGCVQMQGRFCDIQIGYPFLWFMSQYDAAQFVFQLVGRL